MDPGPTPGIVQLTYAGTGVLLDVKVIQCSANCALDLLEVLFAATPPAAWVGFGVEKFVIGRGSYRSGSAGARTRDMVGSAQVLAMTHGVHVATRSASEVKAWALDKRLAEAGLIAPTKGMQHARDAARHALYTAVADGKVPDPLSRRVRT